MLYGFIIDLYLACVAIEELLAARGITVSYASVTKLSESDSIWHRESNVGIGSQTAIQFIL
jgi:hypothetical protein